MLKKTAIQGRSGVLLLKGSKILIYRLVQIVIPKNI